MILHYYYFLMASPRIVSLKQYCSSQQRKDYTALTKFLPPKHEYVLSIRVTPLQCKLYRYYLEHFTGESHTQMKQLLFFLSIVLSFISRTFKLGASKCTINDRKRFNMHTYGCNNVRCSQKSNSRL